MAEVLSQSQIDALLNAARSGEMDLAASAEKTTEKSTENMTFTAEEIYKGPHENDQRHL